MSIWKASALSRRGFLRAGVGLGLVMVNGRALVAPARAGQESDEASEEAADAAAADRALRLYVPHLDESFAGSYWAAGDYLRDALAQISWLMRDPSQDEAMPIDPSLLDTLHALNAVLDYERPLEVLSGYRSPETNRALRREGAAKNSLHLEGKVVDVRIPGLRFSHAIRAAVELGAGGVGAYPHQHFLHLDTGPVRRWTSPRTLGVRRHRGPRPPT